MTNKQKNSEMGTYDEKYYNDIWTRILSRFKITSPVHDFGDVNRSMCIENSLTSILNCSDSRGEIKISDFGSGNWLYLGAIYKALAKWNRPDKSARVNGYDYSSVALNWGIQKYANLKPNYVTVNPITGSIDQILAAEPKDNLDVIISLETLEHLDDDQAAMKQYFDLLKVGGSLIVSVPNSRHIFLSRDWFQYERTGRDYIEKDQLVGHYRVYDTDMMKSRLENAGFKVEKQIGYGFFFHDYFDLFFSKIKSEKIRSIFFPVMKGLNWIEFTILNKFQVKKSAGFFTIAKK